MSAPVDIKPAAPKRSRRVAKPHPVAVSEQLQLNDIERRLIVNFRRMTSKSRACVSTFSHLQAENDVEKARKAAPAVRLVVGGVR